MSKFPPLEKWSPKELVKTYSNCFSPDSEHIFKQFPQIKQALYRLGTNLDMKECWDKLLFKKEFLPKQEYASVWMVSQIYLMLVDVFMRSDGVMTPQFKKKEIKKQNEERRCLQGLKSTHIGLRRQPFLIFCFSIYILFFCAIYTKFLDF